MKCIVGMSGGVDSSTSVALMKERGYQVVGCTFKMFESAKSAKAIDNARRVAEFLGIDHEVIDCMNDFKKHVMDYFVNSYENGFTPNPCVLCNKFIKFSYLNEARRRHQADLLVTGHYVQIRKKDGRIDLFQAADIKKDQSYFLYGVDRDILQFAEFPLGTHPSKNYTRELARKFGIHVAEESESQDICFLMDNDYVSFVKNNSSKTYGDGDILDESGRVVGKHNGTINYTIGQRKGLGLSGGPFFVSHIDPANNRIVISDKAGVEVTKIRLRDVKFINGEYLGECAVKVRSINKKIPAAVLKDEEGYVVELHQPEYGVAQGQHCVFYDNDIVIGGGVVY